MYYTNTTDGEKEVVYSLEFVSLFDYLGHAAGPELGKQVAEAATREGVSIDSKEVSTKKYSGVILMYPKNWLDKYFAAEAAKRDQMELPF